MNNCSRFADCVDLENGYRCQCKQGYFDNDQRLPGRQCAFGQFLNFNILFSIDCLTLISSNTVINECDFPNLNDCHQHATCTDLPGGYTCQCPPPFTDQSPDPARAPGRLCLLNECEHPGLNDCHAQAVCQDTPDSFVCHCNEGFVDASPDPRKSGRNCQKCKFFHRTLNPNYAIDMFQKSFVNIQWKK